MKHKINQEQYSYLNLAKPDVPEGEEEDEAGQTITTTTLVNITSAQQETQPNNNNNNSALQKLLETLELSINELYITFCEESGLDLQPLAIVKLQLNGRVSNWTKNLHLKAKLSLEASYYNDRISNWEPLIENCMEREDTYRPWLISVWFAMEPGGILQPPIDQKGIRSIDFPIQDIDYSTLEEDQRSSVVDRRTMPAPPLEHVPSESMFDGESSKLSSKANRKLVKQQLKQQQQQQQQKKATVTASGSATPRPKSRADSSATDEENKNKMENRNAPIASYVQIESNDILNLNVTPSAYRVIMYLAQITAGSSDKEFLESKVKPPLKFLNFVGEKCDLIISNECFLEPENAVGFNLNSEMISLKNGGVGNGGKRTIEFLLFFFFIN